MALFLPGQPVSTGQSTARFGSGTYLRDGVTRASLLGEIENKDGVRERTQRSNALST